MNIRGIITLLWLMFVTFIGSDILKAELLTDIGTSPDQASPDKRNQVSIINTGLLQADNVIVLLTANDTISDFSGKCVEGKISKFDDKTLLVKFSRMSPSISCEFDVKVHRSVLLNYQIIADNRINPKTDLQSWLLISLSVAIPAILFLTDAYIIYALFRKHLINGLCWIDTHKHNLSGRWEKFEVKVNSKETALYVKKEYGVSIDYVDATILEWIHAGKTTPLQLKAQTHLSLWHIRSRIAKITKYGLLIKDEEQIHSSLVDHFDKQQTDNPDRTP